MVFLFPGKKLPPEIQRIREIFRGLHRVIVPLRGHGPPQLENLGRFRQEDPGTDVDGREVFN